MRRHTTRRTHVRHAGGMLVLCCAPGSSATMGKGQIKHLLSKTQRQQRLSQPVDISSSTLSCLPQNTQLYFRGFSELRQVASWMSEALECAGERLSATEECHVKLTPPGEAWPPASQYRDLSACREELFARRPHHTTCRGINATLHYEWKSRMWSEYDATFHRRLVEAASSSSAPVLAILNGGPHHFNHLQGHDHGLHHSVPDSFAFPQQWFDDYLEGANALFAAFSPRTLPANVCVLWRTSNVGPRLGVQARQTPLTAHHPSARNGFHDWLNRWSAALARKAGIGVVDLDDITSAVTPRSPDGSVDMYHGFNSSLVLEPFVARACAACSPSWKRASGSRGARRLLSAHAA